MQSDTETYSHTPSRAQHDSQNMENVVNIWVKLYIHFVFLECPREVYHGICIRFSVFGRAWSESTMFQQNNKAGSKYIGWHQIY